MGKKKAGRPDSLVFAVNRRARHDYMILENYEAGIALSGPEVKAVRVGKASLQESYARLDRQGQLWLVNAHIAPYQPQPGFQSDHAVTTRRRRLLMHRAELDRLGSELGTKGVTLVPLGLYGVRGRIKLEIGLARGKKHYDKREDIKRRDIERDLRRSHKGTVIKL